MKKNHRFILPASLLFLTLGGGGGITGPVDASAAEMRTISVNFTGGGGGNHPVNTDAFKGQLIGCGDYARPGSNWVDCTSYGAIAMSPEGTQPDDRITLRDDTGNEVAYKNVKVFLSSNGGTYWNKNRYSNNNATVGTGNKQMRFTFLDDGGSGRAGIKLEGVPFSQYTVVVYFNQDCADGAGTIPAYWVNGALYKGADGGAVPAEENDSWGNPGADCDPVEGVNTLIVRDLTGSTLLVKAANRTKTVRACISGFQVVDQKPLLSWKGGDGNWSAAGNWTSPWEDGSAAVFPGTGGTVSVDTNASVFLLEFDGDYTLADAGGTIALSGPVTVAEGKTASILANLSGALSKSGAGRLVFDPDLAACPSYFLSGPATVQDGAVTSAVALAADAALTLKNVELQTPLAGCGTPLALEGTNTIGARASLGGFSGTAFGTGSLTRIACPIAFAGLGTIAAGEGSRLALEAGAGITYDFALGMNLPVFTELDGEATVTVTGTLTHDQILDAGGIPVAQVADNVSIGTAFTGEITTSGGDAIGAVFTNDNGTVKMRADITPADLVYTKADGAPEFIWDKSENIFDNNGTFRDFDNVAFRDGGRPGVPAAVTVPESVLAGRVEIESGFVFTGRTVNALSFVKKGAGTSAWHNVLIARDAAVEEGMLDAGVIAAGTLAVSNGAALRAGIVNRRAMRFLRLTITRGDTQGAAIKELRLFRRIPGGGYEKIAWPAGTATTASDGSNPWCLIDDIAGWESSQQKWWPQSFPATAVIELPEAIPPADGYNICNGDWARYSRSPTAWTVEISPDGEEGSWTAVSDVKDVWAGSTAWFSVDIGGGADAPAFLFDAPAAADVAAVTVADGGTLVADGDWTAGLAMEGGAALKAVPYGCLMLKTAGSAAAQFGTEPKVTIDLTGFDVMAAGKHYILAGDDMTGWPAADAFTVRKDSDDLTFGKDDAGYYAGLASRALVWNPGGTDTKLWITGDKETTPWRKEDDTPAFFRDGDAVTFGLAGGGGGVNVSGTVKPASAGFGAGAAYALLPEAGGGAGLVVTGAFDVAGTVTNGVPGAIGGPVTLAAGGTLALAPGGDAGQTVSGEISGEGSLVKAGGGTARLTGKIAHTGSFAVNGGTLVIDAENTFPAERGNPVTVGPGAAIRFDKANGRNLMSANGWLLCDGGRVELKGVNPFDQEALPNFILTNGATLFADCSVGNGHLNLNRIELGGSVILISKAAKGYDGEGLTAKEGIAAAGDCSVAYQENSGDNLNTLRVWNGVIDVAAGGTLNVAVKVHPRAKGGDGTKYDIPLRKTGPGTLVAAKDADFVTGVQIEKGVLSLPQEAGTFEGAVTFAPGTEIDISGRTNAYAWGEKLAVPAGVRAGVRAWDGVGTGDVLMTWDEGHEPAGEFSLVGRAGFSLKKTATALEVVPGGMAIIIR